MTWVALSIVLMTGAADSDSGAIRITKNVTKLDYITSDRRTYFADNPDGKTPAELNQMLTEINAVEVDNEASSALPGKTLRVIAWNIERGRRWREAAQLIEVHPALQNPDIVLLSEMDLGMGRSSNEHTTRELAQKLGMNYAYAVEFLELSAGREDEVSGSLAKSTVGYHGNAILSRFKLENVRAVRFPGIEKWYGSGEHRLGDRNAVVAEIQWDGQPVTLVSTHLESGLLDNRIRGEQTGMILDELDTHAKGQPVIFGGDLNSPHRLPAVSQLVQAGFDIEGCNLLAEPTMQRIVEGQVTRMGLHIDYLALRGLKAVLNATSPAVVTAAYPDASGTLISDHAAVACEVELPTK